MEIIITLTTDFSLYVHSKNLLLDQIGFCNATESPVSTFTVKILRRRTDNNFFLGKEETKTERRFKKPRV